MKLAEIAARIRVHLKRIESDPEINVHKDARREQDKTYPYWNTNAYHAGRYVGVIYVSYQGASNLTKDEAERYLEWLDAGNNGNHWKALGK